MREIIKRAECARLSRSLAPSPEPECEAVAQFLALGVTPKAIFSVAKRLRRDRAKIQAAIERLFERPKFRPGPRRPIQFDKILWISMLT